MSDTNLTRNRLDNLKKDGRY
ncbi:MAG: hypothetical protein RLZZ248_1429, partial [Bacteroidota bacterium]